MSAQLLDPMGLCDHLQEGSDAFMAAQADTTCTHPVGSQAHAVWMLGWSMSRNLMRAYLRGYDTGLAGLPADRGACPGNEQESYFTGHEQGVLDRRHRRDHGNPGPRLRALAGWTGLLENLQLGGREN